MPDEVYFTTKLPKTVANDTSIGDLTTLEGEASVEEVIKSYQELKKAKAGAQ